MCEFSSYSLHTHLSYCRQLLCAHVRIYNTSMRRCTDFRLNPLPTTSHSLAIISSQRTNSLHKPHVFSRDMADHSRSTRFRARFMSALQAYKQTTGVTLIEHPLTVQLQNCHSVESITTLLKYEARPFSGLLGSDGMLTSIESIVSILSTLSSSAPFGEAIGLVRQNALMGCSISLSVFAAIPTYESNPCWSRYPTCCMCRPPVPVEVPFDIQVKQASKRANSGFDTLVDFSFLPMYYLN